ncbi:hypothetical protein CCP3SC5AM1_610001 [Gammaproteobacteria bacterium]
MNLNTPPLAAGLFICLAERILFLKGDVEIKSSREPIKIKDIRHNAGKSVLDGGNQHSGLQSITPP